MKNKVLLFRKFKNIETFGFNLLILYIVMLAFFSIMTRQYFSITNFKVMTGNFSIVGIVAVGVFMPLLAGSFDLSIGGNISLLSVLIVFMFNIGLPVLVVILISLVIGSFIGTLNGIICNIIRINPVIATLGTGSILAGSAKLIATFIKKEDIFNPSFQLIGSTIIVNVLPILFVYMLIIYIGMALFLKYTKFGRNIYAVGGNFEIARMAGINSNKVQFITFVISGLFSSIGAILLTSQLAMGTSQAGARFTLDALTICVLGGLVLGKGKGDLFGTFMAVLIVGSITSGLIMLGITSYIQYIVNGSILIIAIALNAVRFQRTG